MPFGVSTFQEAQPIASGTTFAAADTTVAKTVTGSPVGYYRIDQIVVCSNDTVAQVIDIFYRSGSTNYLLGSVSIPAGTGTAGTKGIDALAAVLPTTMTGIVVHSGDQIFAGMEATISAAKTVTVTAFGGTF